MSVITISRQFGAGGKTLGERLAKKLNYRLVDEDMLVAVAAKAKVSPHGVASIEEMAGSRLLKFIDTIVSSSFIDRVISGDRGYLDETRYASLVREVILDLAQEGNVVILGRGGQYTLRDHPDACHILLVADKSARVHFLMEEYKTSEKVAYQAMVAADRRRLEFLNCFERGDHDNPIHYTMVLNTGRIGLDRSEKLVLQLLSK